MLAEFWLPVKGFEGVYEVSDWGRVRSVPRVVKSGNRHGTFYYKHKGRILRPALMQNQYFFVRLSQGERGKAWLVPIHQLVLTAFCGMKKPGQVTRHLNDIRTDNRLGNLQWGTYKENTADAIRNGKFPWCKAA